MTRTSQRKIKYVKQCPSFGPLMFHFLFLSNTSRVSRSWALYKIKQNLDKVGVFVSVVSTKIPFKGTGKEYIGDDIEEIAAAVKVISI